MDPETSSKKTNEKASDKAELISLCSCNGCETLRCYLTKQPTNNTDDEEQFSKTCIYFTNITIKNSRSNTDTTNSTNKRSCEICRKESELKNKENLNKCDSLPKTNKKNTACKICKRNIQSTGSKENATNSVREIWEKNIQDIGDVIARKYKPTKIGHVIYLTGEGSNNNDTGKSDNVPDLNEKESEYNERNTAHGFGLKKNNQVDNQPVPPDRIDKLISEWETCRQHIMNDLASNKSTNLDTKRSVCDMCLRNIYKLNNDVDIFNKELVGEALRFNNFINSAAEFNITLPENKPTCPSDIQIKCSTCALKNNTIPKKKLVDTKTSHKQDFHCKGETYGTNNILTEINKQSDCKMCGQYHNKPKQIEKTDTRKLKPSDTIDNESKKEKLSTRSFCKHCSRDIKTNKIDTTNNAPKVPQVTAEVKQKYTANCARKNETYSKASPTNSKFSNFEIYGVTDGAGKKRCHKTNNEKGTRSKSKELNNGCYTRFPKDKAPSTCRNSFILCTCKNHDNFNQANLARESRIINVHNATVNYRNKDLNPSAAKLSAQIMNVPYEDFQESFNNVRQDNVITKTKLKNNLSEEIIKRIKDVYKACSCKICECIAGKSFKLDECNCKPCNCDDCKSYKNAELFAELHDESKLSCTINNCPAEVCFSTRKMQSQYCECTPCDCIKCVPTRTFIAARALENRQANNCSCTPCRCSECERNFFSLSTHVTREMSTGMIRNCGCDQCLDQRCRGAGGTEDCRCEMPSKAIFKPVDKDSHEFDIRHASVCHQRNMKKRDMFDTIAMYASVSSNFAPLGTLKEACSCENCECFACKNEDDKLSIETILKPQLELHAQPIKTNNCVCKSCECDICSHNITECDIGYQDAECTCTECDCINCQTMAKSSTNMKLGNIVKPMGKIYYKKSYSSGSQECDDFGFETNKSLRIPGNKHGQGHHVCMSATLDKNCLMKNNNYDTLHYGYNNLHVEQYQNKNSDTFLLTKTFCNLRNTDNNQCPARGTYMCHKNTHDDISKKIKQYNKILNNFNFTDKDDVVKCNEQFQTDVDKITNKHHRYDRDSVYSLFGTTKIKGEHEIDISQVPLSNYKSNCSKTTSHSCLKDIFTNNEDFNLHPFKIVHDNLNRSQAIYPTQSSESDEVCDNGQKIRPLSSLHKSLYENKFENEQISMFENNTKDLNWNISSNDKLNLSNEQIDYERVHKTLKEAKDFSGQLIKLLEKYERANKDFQSVSEKLKLSHGLNIRSKLGTVEFEFVVIDKPINDHGTFQYTDNGNNKENDHKNHTKTNLYKYQVPIDELPDLSGLKSTNDSNIEMSNEVGKVQNDLGYLRTTESKEFSELNQKPAEYSFLTKERVIANAQTLVQVKLNKNIIQPIQKNVIIQSKTSKHEENNNTNQLNGLNEITSPDLALDNCTEFANSTENKIDNLTSQLSQMIKENVLKKCEEMLSRDFKTYDRSVSVSSIFDVLKSQENIIMEYKDWSVSKKNYYLNNSHIRDTFTSPIFEVVPKLETQSTSAQTSVKKYIDKTYVKVINVKSASSSPRNKTTQVEKESDTNCGITMNKIICINNDQEKSPNNALKSKTEVRQQPHVNVAHCSRVCELTRSKCSCEDLKVCSLSGRRVSDHTVMVKWGRPKQMDGVLGYELLVDGRPVQKIIDSTRYMAVVTCLPNCEKVLLTMRTILDAPLRSGHKPTVTIIYRPRLRKTKNNETAIIQETN
ncbi:uncharacterized protein LOC128672031 [Plodia interpunctella]|uniref:uncharacterized protein LOC128672031 n=1 Tax=Plodia interpunctella TaxID=58824 RepID=UPI002368DB02|nr:uncharacterized protein LOC128672031 [Plodia interpunctella]